MRAVRFESEVNLKTIHVSAISYVIGEPRHIDELGNDIAAQLFLPQQGVTHFRVSDKEIWQLAEDVCARSAARAAGVPDLVLYVSENDRHTADSLARIAHKIGQPNIRYLEVSGHGCGNLGPALQLAADMLYSGAHERVLLVFADRALEGERLMRNGLSVFSDGAAACMITRDHQGRQGLQAQISAVTTKTQVEVGVADAANAQLLTTAELAAAAAEYISQDTGREISEFDHILLANYRILSQKFLASAIGTSTKHHLLIGPVSELGHCFSADILITLERYTISGKIQQGDRLLAAVIGAHSLSMMAIEICQSQ